MEKVKLPSTFQPGNKVGLQMLIDLLEEAKDADVVSVNFTESKVKYNIAVSRFLDGVDIGVFRIANIDSAYLHPPIDNGFHYNSKTSVESRRQRDDVNPGLQAWFGNDGKPKSDKVEGTSVEVLIDLDGYRKYFRVGWYDFDDKAWRFHDTDASSILSVAHMRWQYLPFD